MRAVDALAGASACARAQVCDGLTHAARALCEACRAQPQAAAAVLASRAARLEAHCAVLARACLHCGGGGGRDAGAGGIVCDSLDCGVFFERAKARGEVGVARALCDAGLALL